jgi:hypothetical protein
MDRFLKTKERKTPSQNFAEADVICLWGPPGIGKTHLVEQTGGIWLGEDTLRSKQSTLEFMARVRSADRAVVIDDFESVADLVGLRELTGSPSRGQLFITALAPVKLSFPVLNYEFPIPNSEKIFKIISKVRPDAPPSLVKELVAQCKGSVRYVLRGLEFKSDSPDNFTEPKQDLETLFVKGVKGIPPHLDRLHEHGYSWAVVQENYPDAPNLDMDDIADLAHTMSRADLIDAHVYRTGVWDLLPYFCVEAVFIPAYKIKKSLKKLRPGSLWTKYQNQCMKKKKLDAIFEKLGTKEMDYLSMAAMLPEEFPRLTTQDLSFVKKICTFK